LHIIFVEIQLRRNLLIGQVKSHEIEANHPHFERLMMSFKNGPCQIVKIYAALLTRVALPMFLGVVEAPLVDEVTITMGTTHTL
jgi:4-hydroxy-3-methylbut-2-en-1-yl diphosphate synthase IspG/GcpE